jgi:hypothetical protein
MTEWLMNMELLVEWELAGETEVLGENPPRCHFVQHKSQITWAGMEPVPSYGTGDRQQNQ